MLTVAVHTAWCSLNMTSMVDVSIASLIPCLLGLMDPHQPSKILRVHMEHRSQRGTHPQPVIQIMVPAKGNPPVPQATPGMLDAVGCISVCQASTCLVGLCTSFAMAWPSHHLYPRACFSKYGMVCPGFLTHLFPGWKICKLPCLLWEWIVFV